MSLHSHACCTVPAVVTKGYEPKGTYQQISGLKTYVTGPSSAKKGILVVYDIFGFFPQTLQGADILATGDSHQNYRVYMPDFFEGKPANISDFPPDTDEKKKRMGDFFSGPAAPPKTVEKVKSVMQELKRETGVEEWGVVGYCWGGKIVNLTSAEGTPFKAGAACHPAMVDPNDATNVTIPIAMLPSKDEDKDAVEKYKQNLKVKNHIQWFDDQVHGWMAARGDLEQESVKAKYEEGYQTLLNFFHEHL